ncbi:histidinol dehydrogenase [candidate division KSB1 bacterium]|nr:histidinol dehydrogenase [candidate division KSB1 bacterium]
MNIYSGENIAPFLQRFESRRTLVAVEVDAVVSDILKNVRENGDRALLDYAARFDKVDLNKIGILVPEADLEKAFIELPSSLLKTLEKARENIRLFHQKGLPQAWFTWENDDVVLGQRVMPLERVGVYVPGGRAAYPSSLLMGVVPAQVAGVKEIVITTPCDADGRVNSTILAAARLLGIDKVYRVGGAQAIAAMAYGTDSIPRVDKIVGPGNIYVATAKKMLYGQCGIDMVAGPSEVIIIADETADPVHAAADLLAQAEHDPLASAILITCNENLAGHVQEQVVSQTAVLDRREIIETALEKYGGIILVENLDRCAELSNKLAPEHLGLHVSDPWALLGKITNAGAIFLGSFSPEAVGDYWAGPNHVLPTNGSARFFSPLRTEDFLKTSSVVFYTKTALQRNGEDIVRFARSEGLEAHAQAIIKRIE